jgi:hypothetical protein
LASEVEHRGKAHVHTAGAQLGAEHIAARGGRIAGIEGAGTGRAAVGLEPHLAERTHGRQVGKAVGLEALHAPALVINQTQQVLADVLDLLAQLTELRPVLPIAAKQDHAAGQRVLEAAPIDGRQLQAGDVKNEGAVDGRGRFHGELCSTITKLVA